jgi:SAM-dependent methyltransferase
MTTARKLIFPGASPDAPHLQKDIDLESILASLYREHLSIGIPHPYILEHQQPKCIANQVRTFHWYRPYLASHGAILDWGSYHAPDSCMLRAWYGNTFELHACDFADRNEYRVFHDYSKCEYRQLNDSVRLPYPDETFAAIIASGVLEHTAMDYESLKELYRVLKPEGVIIISYLPNRLSVREWIQRHFHRRDFHRRLYGVSETIQLLKHSGYYPETICYHTFFWQRLAEMVGLRRYRNSFASALRKILPLQIFCSTHCCVARKVRVM